MSIINNVPRKPGAAHKGLDLLPKESGKDLPCLTHPRFTPSMKLRSHLQSASTITTAHALLAETYCSMIAI